MRKKKDNLPDYRHGTFLLATTDTMQLEHVQFIDEFISKHPECLISEIPDENSEEFFDWRHEITDENWESDLESIEECDAYDIPVVVEGSIGRWNGRFSIVPESFKNIITAVRKIISDGCNDYDIHYEDGLIKVSGHHHDGNNTFTIRALSKKGLRKVEIAECNGCDIPEMKKHDYKRIPYLYAI